MRRRGERGQAFIETALMVWLFTLLISAIIQVFLAHNYAFQMANNAYYSLFKDKAYNRHNKPTESFTGFNNWHKKPLRAVTPLQQAGGKIHDQSGGGATSWTSDDRAAIPMMPFFEESIVLELRNRGVSLEPVRLKVGTKNPGSSYMELKFLRMAMGTEGGFGGFVTMIEGLVGMAGEFGLNYADYTGGYDGDSAGDLEDDYDDANGDLNDQDPSGGQKAKDQWDEAHGDYNHDGYNDLCENLHGNNHPNCRNNRPWE